MEGQRRLGFLRAAHDLRGERQAVSRDRVRTEQRRQDQACQHARTQGPAPRHGAVRLRAIALFQDGRQKMRSTNLRSFRLALATATAIITSPALAGDVTPERLANPEPQNWLMNHRTYDAQRYSPLARITKDNVKGLRLAYAVAIGGSAINENLQATPLVEDGFMYIVDLW